MPPRVRKQQCNCRDLVVGRRWGGSVKYISGTSNVSVGSKCERLVESRSFPLCLSKQTLATLARASRSRQLRKAPVEAHEVLAGQVVDPTERIELLEIAQGYFQVADHIAAAALRATEPDSIPDAE
jgi:hypothetical protein